MILFTSPSLTLPIGTTAYGPVTPPASVSSVTVAIDRTLLTSPTLRIDWLIEISYDDGATWHGVAGAGAVGGVLPLNTSSFTIRLNQPTDSATQIRGSITVNEPATTVLTLTGM